MILPNFLICGAQKAGTTALYNYLKQHPNIFMSRPKETGFFNRKERYQRGIEWFARHFEAYDGEKAVGEASTGTMYNREAPARIAQHLPDASLAFVLRNPIDRAYSQYHYYVYTGNAEADRSFHELIRDEESTLRREMVGRGMYAQQLARFDGFFDRTQMKIILHEELREKTEKIVKNVYEFVGADPSFEPHVTSKHNETRYPDSLTAYYWLRRGWHLVREKVESQFPQAADAMRGAVRKILFSKQKPPMREEDRAYLRDIYADPNARLEERIGRDLSHWK